MPELLHVMCLVAKQMVPVPFTALWVRVWMH